MKYKANTPNGTETESSPTEHPSAKYFRIPNIRTETFWLIEKVLDGDSLIVKEEFGQYQKEIRLYGLDAPEIHRNRKIREDEAKTHIPASLLLQYGLMSLDFVLQAAPPGTRVTILTEKENQLDFWKRQLGYIILPSGECLNELLIKNGWAKPSSSYYCFSLHYFQELSNLAKRNDAGIYGFNKTF